MKKVSVVLTLLLLIASTDQLSQTGSDNSILIYGYSEGNNSIINQTGNGNIGE